MVEAAALRQMHGSGTGGVGLGTDYSVTVWVKLTQDSTGRHRVVPMRWAEEGKDWHSLPACAAEGQ